MGRGPKRGTLRGDSCRRFAFGGGCRIVQRRAQRRFEKVRDKTERFGAESVGQTHQGHRKVPIHVQHRRLNESGRPASPVVFVPNQFHQLSDFDGQFDRLLCFGPALFQSLGVGRCSVCHGLPFIVGRGCRSGAFGGLAPERRTGRLATVRAVPKIRRSVML